MDQTPLGDIFARSREAAPTQETQETRQETPAAEGQQPQPQQPPTPQPPPPPPDKPEGQTPQEGGDGPEPATVPIAALHAERGKTKRYTEQVASFETQVSELRNQNSALQRQVSQLLERLPQPQKQPPQDPDQLFYEKPRQAVLQTVEPHLQHVNRAITYNSRLVASSIHGAEVVEEADKAFSDAYARGAIDPADIEKVGSSLNVYDAAVKWHKRQRLLAEIGDDVEAFKKRIRDEALAETQPQPGNGAPQNGAATAQAPVMPSNLAGARNVGNRSGPKWPGPDKIEDIFARHRSPR
jgi:hypothetical protein